MTVYYDVKFTIKFSLIAFHYGNSSQSYRTGTPSKTQFTQPRWLSWKLRGQRNIWWKLKLGPFFRDSELFERKAFTKIPGEKEK